MVHILVALSNNSDFMCFQKIHVPHDLYLGQCLVNLEVLYMAIMSIGAFRRLCWVSYCTLIEQELGNPEDRYAVSVFKVVDYRRTYCNY